MKAVLKATIGDEVKYVEVSHAAGSGGFSVTLDGYHWGRIHLMHEGWQYSTNVPNWFQVEDIEFMINTVKRLLLEAGETRGLYAPILWD